jgi:hypothetical protein
MCSIISKAKGDLVLTEKLLITTLLLILVFSGCGTANQEPIPDTMYFVLGMLDEYNGRKIYDGKDLVDSFYLNERKQADAARHYLEQLAAEIKLETEIVSEETDSRINYYSAELAEAINAQYLDVTEFGYTGDDPPKTVYIAKISMDVLLPEGEEAKVAYLAGAYFRFFYPDCPNTSRDGCFFFAGSTHKVELVLQLLEEFKCIDIDSVTTTDMYPDSTSIWFTPSPELEKAFDEVDQNLQR